MGPYLRAMTVSRLALGLALAALMLAASPAAEAAGKRPVVVELFTSQGCSSCPPADSILGHLADRRDVLALTLPVTYWDMLGWKDTLASDADTRRQKSYAAAMGRGGVYTPQMIIDGVSDVVGSREQQVEQAVTSREGDMVAIPVEMHLSHAELEIKVGAGDAGLNPNATIWLFHIMGRASVAVGTGENGGRTLTYRNVVRDIKAVGMWKGQPVTLDLPRTELTNAPHDAIAVVVQQNGYGRILGAAEINRTDYAIAW
ncbi:MAG TPA: DUF1223 domain-containing protein [Rhizomicrobium sp.]|nr:DUF1223 domain-containing protein [Rhizomicrobium sp.]